MSDEVKDTYLSDAKGLRDFVSVDLTIKLFGKVIWEFHFPPKNQ